jgi:hypothetical protein
LNWKSLAQDNITLTIQQLRPKHQDQRLVQGRDLTLVLMVKTFQVQVISAYKMTGQTLLRILASVQVNEVMWHLAKKVRGQVTTRTLETEPWHQHPLTQWEEGSQIKISIMPLAQEPIIPQLMLPKRTLEECE